MVAGGGGAPGAACSRSFLLNAAAPACPDIPPLLLLPPAAVLRAMGEAAQPLVAAVKPHIAPFQPLVAHAVATVAPRLQLTAAWANSQLAGLEPWQVVLLTTAALLLLSRVWRGVKRGVRTVQDKGALRWPAPAGGYAIAPPDWQRRPQAWWCPHRHCIALRHQPHAACKCTGAPAAAEADGLAPLFDMLCSLRACCCRPGPAGGGVCA